MKKGLALICAVILLLTLSACAPLSRTRTDLGGFSGSSDYGSSDWGSSSSWGGSSDWGSSSSWGSSSDWGSSGHYYGSSGDVELSDTFKTILGAIIVFTVVIVIMAGKRKGGASSGRPQQSRPAGASRTPGALLQPMAAYKELDGNFSEKQLSEKLSNLYVQMQECCTARDVEPLRPYFADPLYQQFARQMRELKSCKRTNYVERVAVLGVNLRGWRQIDGEDHIIAEISTRITDYTLEDETGRLVSGERDAEKFMVYEYDLSRPSGMKTAAEEDVANRHCPNCGAPLSINETARCPYCDSVITLREHDWTVCAIRGISQQTVRR